ncbi:MAG: hypothetical protein DMD87_04245 [Candidatus Rokuibacteriota bacterium]|nr:MAG: hypothetical protein DMD87_04245 [Candidatus Rokubacteria bacterium]
MGRVARVAALVAFVVSSGCAAERHGVLDLSWTAPATNTDGSPLTDIVAYRVYYGTTPGPCPGGTFLTIPSSQGTPGQTVRTKLTELKVGEIYYIAVTALSKNGRESDCSAPTSARARRAQ